ncbi:A/G-specific adenine glycosylase [Parasediminibacterium sp. JCM 36343]|uniref:A/G-specific adenine glycosylase n=1 Tax=Parasediminibacterium sp. JCM 36343 TaxID=3374279 RepID=UPI00397A0705
MEEITTSLLMGWHSLHNTRQMPWKGEKDPYKIWLSEIILQQTRVEQGLAYYEKFVSLYPTIQNLAAAKDEVVFKLWEGLGYYNRCKNLLATARYITDELGGLFPSEYKDIVALKGIGPYTAAAIASFAFNKPYAVLDGNVFRVLSRLFAIDSPIDSTIGKHQFATLAQEVLDKEQPALYNQAIMDFGATVCKPVNPQCHACYLQNACAAYSKVLVNKLPVKEKVLLKKNRWFYYFIIQHQGTVWVQKRTTKDIWQNLYEFYLLEANEQQTWTDAAVQAWLYQQLGISNAQLLQVSPLQKQQLTHQQIRGQFIRVNIEAVPANMLEHQWQPIDSLSQLALPRFINQYLEASVWQGDLF